MTGLRGAKGVAALLGRAPADDFEHYFGAPKAAFKTSLTAIGGSVLLIMISARHIIALQHSLSGQDHQAGFPALHIGITAIFYLLSFTALAYVFAASHDKKSAYWRWASARHWLVFYSLILTALMTSLTSAGLFPVFAAHAVLFILFIGMLFADIRLAHKLGALGWISAIFAACMVHALGVTVILSAVLQSLG